MSRPHLHFTSLSPPEICGDIVESYRLAAEKLGYSTSYSDRTFQPGTINILFFFWDVAWEVIAPYYPDCIVVNFEPMVVGTHAWRDNYRNVLQQCYLWEYSKSNFQRYRELGFRNADYVPLGYEEEAATTISIDSTLPDAEQDIDVVFFGTKTQRRVKVLDALIQRGLRVMLTQTVEGWSIEERNGYLRRAKVVLNLHNWENSRVVELPRLTTLLRQRKAVVCELYPDSEIDPLLRDAVAGVPYEGLVDTVIELVADAPRRAELERKGLALLRRNPQTKWVAPALERFLSWRALQPDRIALPASMPQITVCIVLSAMTDEWHHRLRAWIELQDAQIEIVIVAPQEVSGVESNLAWPNSTKTTLRLIRWPNGTCERAAGRNLALAHAHGKYLVFCGIEDLPLPQRLQRQAVWLENCAALDVVGCWCEKSGAIVRFAERHHEILAEFLGTQPLPLSACMLRRSFLETHGLRHDPEFAAHDDLHFLCKSAAAGARFAVIPEVLHRLALDTVPLDPVRTAMMAGHARAVLLRRLLPQSTQEEIERIVSLYAHLWPPTLEFCEELLTTLAHVCAGWRKVAMAADQEMLTRALRHEALRLLKVFFDAGLANLRWLEAQYADQAIADFLAPASEQLPVRPFRSGSEFTPLPV